MSKEMFRVKDRFGQNLGYYEATSKGQAKKAVIAGIKVEKLSGAEIHSVYKAGYGVFDVVDGEVVDAEPSPASDQAELTLPTASEAQTSAG